MKKPGLWIIAGLFIGISVWIVLANHQMKQNAGEIRTALLNGIGSGTEITSVMTESMPTPVQRYLAFAIDDRKQMDVLVRLKHAGWIQINRDVNDDANPDWKYFFAENTIRLDKPSFFWQGMIHLGWEFYLKGWVNFRSGDSEMIWTWMGTLPVWQRREPAMETFGLGQMLIQAPWMPTLLLSSNVRWEAIDDTTARADMSAGSVEISGIFHFDSQGRIVRFISDDWKRITSAGVVSSRRMVKYAYYKPCGQYQLPERLFYFIESPAGWFSDMDLRLDEIVHD